MAGNGNPTSLANLKPWRAGDQPTNNPRRSTDTEKAIKAFRKLTPEAADYAGRILRDETESTGYRLKAMEAILKYGMPRKLEEILAKSLGEGTRAFMRVEFIRPGDDAKDLDAKPNGHGGTFEVTFGNGK